MVVGGLAHPASQFQAEHEFIAVQVAKGRQRMNIAAAIGVVLIAVYLWVLVVVWNLGVALGATMRILAVFTELIDVRLPWANGADEHGRLNAPAGGVRDGEGIFVDVQTEEQCTRLRHG